MKIENIDLFRMLKNTIIGNIKREYKEDWQSAILFEDISDKSFHVIIKKQILYEWFLSKICYFSFQHNLNFNISSIKSIDSINHIEKSIIRITFEKTIE